MLFATPEVSFDLQVVGYQFPAEHEAAYDSNWLNVRISVTHPLGSWSCTDPALLTYELSRLASWFVELSGGDRTRLEESFLEPNLTFEIVTGSVEKLRVSFRLEFSPPWAGSTKSSSRPYVEFPLDAIDLAAAGATLLEELARFPQRAER